MDPRGALGMVLEGSENGVEKRDPPKECDCCMKEGGPPLKESKKETRYWIEILE